MSIDDEASGVQGHAACQVYEDGDEVMRGDVVGPDGRLVPRPSPILDTEFMTISAKSGPVERVSGSHAATFSHAQGLWL